MGTEIEFLAVGNCILRKDDQNAALKQDYTAKYELD
jgi:carbamoyltransferase